MRSILFILLFPFIAFSQTKYYVSKTGSDAAAGTSTATAWKTIAKVNATSFAAGDSIFFMGDSTYYGTLIPPTANTSYVNYPGHKPVICGGEKVSTWASVGGGIYKATLDSGGAYVHSVTFDGVSVAKGRYPKKDSAQLYAEAASGGGAWSTGQLKHTYFTGKKLAGSEIVMRRERWLAGYQQITAHSNDTITYYSMNYGNYGEFFLQDNIQFVTEYKEWFYNDTTKELFVYFGAESPSAHTVIASFKNYAVDVTKDDVKFSGLTFSHGNSYAINVSADRVTFDSCTIQDSHNGAYFSYGADNCTFKRGTIKRINNNGIYSLGKKLSISDNSIKNISMLAGMAEGGDGQSHTIWTSRYGGPGFPAYNGSSDSCKVERNILDTMGYVGIRFDGYATEVNDNRVTNFCLVKEDGGAIYTYDNYYPIAYTGRKVQRNFVDGKNSGHAVGIYIDDHAKGIFIDSNIVNNCSEFGLFLHNTFQTVATNNYLYNNGIGLLIGSDAKVADSSLGHLTVTGNKIIAGSPRQLVLSFYTSNLGYDDIDSLGTLNYNTYSYPFTDTTIGPIQVWYMDGLFPATVTSRRRYLSFKEFQHKYIHETNGTMSPVKKALYTINSLGTQMHSNSTAATATNFHAGSFSNTTVGLETKLDGSSFKMSYATPSATTRWSGAYWDIGPTNAQHYIIRFSAKSAWPTTINVAVSHSEDFIDDVPAFYAEIDSSRQDSVEFLIRPNVSATYGKVHIRPLDEYTAPLWIDNLVMYPATITPVTPTITELNNKTYATESYPVTGTWRDLATGSYYTNETISLPAHRSMIIMQTDAPVNQSPTVSAGSDQTFNYLTTSASVTATASDPDGTIASYAWTQLSGTTATIVSASSATTSITGLGTGTSSFRCTVTDNGGATAYDDVLIVRTANTAPTSSAGSDQTITLPTAAVTLSGSGSDAETSVTYAWTRISGPNTPTIVSASSASTSVTGLIAGTYVFRLTVTDGGSLTATDDISITVNPAAPVPPSIKANWRLLTNSTPSTPTADEFVSFPSWATLTATGVAATDRANLQAALDTITRPLILSGNFVINATIYLTAKQNISIVGRHPDSTSIKWTGAASDTMIVISGVAYSRLFQRMTLDGDNIANTIVFQNYLDPVGVFDTGNEYESTYFKNAAFGIKGGYGAITSFAETVVRRCKFTGFTSAAITTGNFNALDLWVWDSYFDNNYYAITNYVNSQGQGNFHAYRNVFKNSSEADMRCANTEGFSARDNYSIGAKRFFHGTYSQNSAQIILQGNTILDPVEQAVAGQNHGPLIMMDNKIRSTGGIFFGPDPNGEIISIGNSYSAASPIANYGGRLLQLNDLTSQTITATEPTFIYQSRSTSPIIEVTSTIQAAVNSAYSLYNGQKPIVHFSGTKSESVNLSGDVQLVGDGYDRSTITGSVTVSGTATLKDIKITGAVTVANTFFADQLQCFFSGITHNSGETTIVNSGIAYGSDTAVEINGGTVHLFASQGSNANNQIAVNSGSAFLTDYWYENGTKYYFSNLTNGTLFINGARLASPTSGVNILNNTGGTLTVIGANIDDDISASDSTLLLGNYIHTSPYLTTSIGAAQSLYSRGTEQLQMTNIGDGNTSFITQMLTGRKGVPVMGSNSIKAIRVRIENSSLTIN